jgi:hypothetical protein
LKIEETKDDEKCSSDEDGLCSFGNGGKCKVGEFEKIVTDKETQN